MKRFNAKELIKNKKKPDCKIQSGLWKFQAIIK